MIKTAKCIGLIGAGHWGTNILRVLYQLKAIKTICDLDKTKLLKHQQKYPGIVATSSEQKLLTDKDIKAIVIATPANTHYNLAKKALNASKDIFVEKPLALSPGEGRKIIKLAQKKKKIVMVGHILHYHPAIIKLKQLIDTGKLGPLQYIYSNRLNIGRFRNNENIFWSFAPHDISAILMLTNKIPVKVTTFGEAYLNKKICDTTITTLTFSNKLKSHIFVSWLHPYKEQKLVVIGKKCMAVFDDTTKEKLFLYPHKITLAKRKVPLLKKSKPQIIKTANKEPLKEELLHFIDCIKSRKKPKTDGQEALEVLKILKKGTFSPKKNCHGKK